MVLHAVLREQDHQELVVPARSRGHKAAKDRARQPLNNVFFDRLRQVVKHRSISLTLFLGDHNIYATLLEEWVQIGDCMEEAVLIDSVGLFGKAFFSVKHFGQGV